MKPWSMQRWGIRTRALSLAVIPIVFVTLLLGTYLVDVRLEDISRSLEARGQLLARYLAPASEFGLFSGDRRQLKAAADAAVKQSEVLAVTIVSADGEVVVRSVSDPDAPNRLPPDLQGPLVFTEPVRQTGIAVAPFAEEPPLPQTAPRMLGRVVVEMKGDAVKARQREVFLNTTLITALALALSILLATRTSRSVALPILRLHSVVERLGKGELDARVEVGTGGELGQLAEGFNAMAAQLQYAQQGLHMQIAEATGELRATIEALEGKNRELEIARQQALKAGQEKAQFLATMSHEIRTPVNAVIGFADLLDRTALDETQRDYSRTIQQAGRQLIAIIDDILDFSKLEAGSVVPEQVLFDTRTPIEDAVTMLRPAAHEKGLELTLLMESSVPDRLTGDPARLRQILLNLISNAVKFTATGHIRIRAWYEHHPLPGRLHLAVTDTGIGISEAQQKNLFRAFAQADNSISRRFGGTGLGLAIVDRLVRLMDGRIQMSSAPGQGSSFHLDLTLPGSASASRHPLAPNAPCLLLCAPDPFTQRALSNDLSALGYGVLAVESLAEIDARLHAEPTQPSALVISVSSEELDSVASEPLRQRIRAIFHGPILLLLGMEEERVTCNLEADLRLRCLPKPPRLEALASTLQEMLATRGGADPKAETTTRPAFVGKRVLVVEDNVLNRKLAATLLAAAGIRVTEAFDGTQALQRVAEQPFDLIFMDVHMPTLDGIETTRRIREGTTANRGTPIVAITADVFAEERERMSEAGFDDWLLKPIVEEKLLKTLGRWIVNEGRTPPEAIACSSRPEPGERSDRPKVNVPESLRARLFEEVALHAEALEAAFDENDEKALRQHAHTLHGLSGYFGIPELADASRHLERAIKQGESAAIPDGVQRVIERVERLLAGEAAAIG